MIEYASDIALLGMLAFVGGAMGIIFIHWTKWITWELNSEEREDKQ